MDDSITGLIGRIIRLLVVLAFIGVIANDAIQVGRAFSRASDGMNAAMTAALDSAAKNPTAVEAARTAAAAAAEARGTMLESFEQRVGESLGAKRAQVTLSVSAPVGRTVVAAPVIGLMRNAPRAEWYRDPRVRLRETKQVDVFGQ